MTRADPPTSHAARLGTFVRYKGWEGGAAATQRCVQKWASCLKHAQLDSIQHLTYLQCNLSVLQLPFSPSTTPPLLSLSFLELVL